MTKRARYIGDGERCCNIARGHKVPAGAIVRLFGQIRHQHMQKVRSNRYDADGVQGVRDRRDGEGEGPIRIQIVPTGIGGYADKNEAKYRVKN